MKRRCERFVTFERPHIAAISGYTPGEQPQDPAVIKLNTNENPYPPTPAVAEALHSFDAQGLRRYPEPSSRLLRQAIGQRLGVDESRVLITNGGDELLRLAITTFCEPGSWILSTAPTYSLYPVLAGLQGCRYKGLPLEADLSFPRALGDEAQSLRASLVLVVNPHAPSGQLFALRDLQDLARRVSGVLLIDEAYVDFVDPSLAYNALELVDQHANVLLLRTFSKGYSLAGLRLGYGVADGALIESMNKLRDSFNLDALAQRLGLAALADEAYRDARLTDIRRERARVTQALRSMGFEVPDSQTNFVNARPPSSMDPESLYESLKARKILVRYFAGGDSIRISIGTPTQNQTLIEVLAELLHSGRS